MKILDIEVDDEVAKLDLVLAKGIHLIDDLRQCFPNFSVCDPFH